MIAMFVELIRVQGRQGRYVDFLYALCTNEGKAVRKNQWRVCQMFITEAPELHVQLSLEEEGTPNERVVVRADAQYFPAFVGVDKLEVCLHMRRFATAHICCCSSMQNSLVPIASLLLVVLCRCALGSPPPRRKRQHTSNDASRCTKCSSKGVICATLRQ